MRNTFAIHITGVLLTLYLGPLWALDVQICTDDPFYQGLWGNPNINYDASTFCNSLLSKTPVTSCFSTSTSRTTTFPNAETTLTTTAITNVPASTITVTTTVTVFDVATPSKPTTTSPAVTGRAKYVRQQMADIVRIPAVTTTGSSRRSVDLTASLASACTCYPYLSAETSNVICTFTSTVTDGVITRTTSTVYKTVTSGVTTFTSTLNETTTIQPGTTSAMSSPATTWTTPVSSPTTISTSTMTMTTTSSTSTATTSSTIGTSISSKTTSSSTSIATVQPSGCPVINGTRFSTNSKDCTYYQRVCFRTYADSDFYEANYNYATPEECTAVCDAQNRGMNTVCLGIVWNTTTTTGANCRQLKKLTSPLDDSSSIAMILQRDPNCGASNSTSVASTTSTSSKSTTSASTLSVNGTTSSSANVELATTSTKSSINSTTATTSSSWLTTSMTKNGTVTSYCIPSTIYATQYQTVTVEQGFNSSWTPWPSNTTTKCHAKTVTHTINANATTVTTTVINTGNNTFTTTKTEIQTTTATYLSVSTTAVSSCPSATSTSTTWGTTSITSMSPTIVTPTSTTMSGSSVTPTSSTTTSTKHRHWSSKTHWKA